jgi:hypothetical protein
VVRGVLAGDDAAMGETAALAFRFAQAQPGARHGDGRSLRDEIVRRWGERRWWRSA